MPEKIVEEFVVYRFDELADSIRERICMNYQLRHDWWEFVYEDAKEIGKLFGVTVKDIWFSGFWNQGDGACFEGDFEYRKGALAAVREYAPQDEELHRIVKDYCDIQRKYFYKLYGSVTHRGHYYHSGCTDITIKHEEGNKIYLWYSEIDIDSVLRRFMDWIYDRLEAEYTYQTSEEVIGEAYMSEGARFLVDGTLYDWGG